MKRVLFSGKSPFQRVDIVETAGHGRMLLNDGLVMVSERDEHVYHEMIAHVPLFVHSRPQRVLVIGGGDGGTVREVLRHPSVEHVRLVEIDQMVVDACREHLPATAACLSDPRVQVTIADGVRFVAETDERYDVVLVDSTDPIGPAAPLFGREFYGNVRDVLTERGIVVSQAENPFYEQAAQRSLLATLRDRVPGAGPLQLPQPDLPGRDVVVLLRVEGAAAARGLQPAPRRRRRAGPEVLQRRACIAPRSRCRNSSGAKWRST